MIKLKNLWKIALATMAMSAMLVACDTTKKEDEPGSSGGEQKVVAKGGEGIYNYTVNIADISKAWGGTVKSPAFSIVLLTDKQLEACKTAADFKQATAANPEYQISAYGNMKITDTSNDGNFAVWGASPVDDVYQYYTGVAAAVTATTFTLTVDMTKLVQTDLKALFAANAAVKDEAVMTNDDIVDLKGYKPYVLALGQQIIDADNYQMTAWSADLMKMTAGATLPENLKKAAPVVPTAKDITCIVGSINTWAHTKMTNNTATFTAAGGDQFSFTNGSWDYRFADAVIDALDKEVKLKEYLTGDPPHVTFADGVLTVGSEYTVTFTVVDNHNATVKVSAKK